MSKILTLQQVAQLLRDEGITGDPLIQLTAAAQPESGGPVVNGVPFGDWGAEGDLGLQTAKWGPSIGFLQVRSLRPGRAELASEPHRGGGFLRASPGNQAKAVAAIYRQQGLRAWSVINSGAHRRWIPQATAAAASLGGTQVSPGGAETPALTPPAPAVTAPPTASLVSGLAVFGPSSLVLEGEKLSGLADIVSAALGRSIDDAASLTVHLVDTDNRLIESGLLDVAARTTFDGMLFQLLGVARSARDITLTMIDAAAAVLISDIPVEKITQAPNTASRGDFLRRLAGRHAWIQVDIETGADPAVELAVEEDESVWQALGRIAGEVGWRRLAVANRLAIGSDSWLASRNAPITIREHADGIDRIDFDFLVGEPVSRATVICDTTLWSAPPSQAVIVEGLGPASGEWLVTGISKSSTASTQARIELSRVQPPLDEPVPPPPPASYDDTGGTAAGAPVVPGAVSGQGWQWPMAGRVSSEFGPRRSPGGVGSTNHKGIDIAAPTGTPIYAARSGTVTVAGTAGGYGNAVYINHGGGLFSRYGHMSRVGVTRGQQVQQGQQIGKCGSTGNSTGPHCHFEVRVSDSPVNPRNYLPAR